jgi:hypothetical protein
MTIFPEMPLFLAKVIIRIGRLRFEIESANIMTSTDRILVCEISQEAGHWENVMKVPSRVCPDDK